MTTQQELEQKLKSKTIYINDLTIEMDALKNRNKNLNEKNQQLMTVIKNLEDEIYTYKNKIIELENNNNHNNDNLEDKQKKLLLLLKAMNNNNVVEEDDNDVIYKDNKSNDVDNNKSVDKRTYIENKKLADNKNNVDNNKSVDKRTYIDNKKLADNKKVVENKPKILSDIKPAIKEPVIEIKKKEKDVEVDEDKKQIIRRRRRV
jgi:hypothetical protein